jgi:hypothetical protein
MLNFSLPFCIYDLHDTMLGKHLPATGDQHDQTLYHLRTALEILYLRASRVPVKRITSTYGYPPDIVEAALYHSGKARRDGFLIHEGRYGVQMQCFVVRGDGLVTDMDHDPICLLWCADSLPRAGICPFPTKTGE